MADMDNLDTDVRLLRRQLAKGFISREAVDATLDDLPDVADKGEWLDPEAEFQRELEDAAADDD